jgi:hypothetical protein
MDAWGHCLVGGGRVGTWVDGRVDKSYFVIKISTDEPGYNIGLCDTSSIASDILWYRLIPHC